MKKKIPALFLVLVMVCGLLSPGTMAEERLPAPDAEILLTVSDRGVLAADQTGAVMANRPVTVKDLNADGVLTVHEALAAAHAAFNSPEGYETSETQYGTSVTKLWGTATWNTLFFVNGSGLTVGVGADTVQAGDALLASLNADDTYYADWYTAFDRSTATVAVGEALTLTLTGGQGMAYPADFSRPAAGVKIGTWNGGAFVQTGAKVTDAGGTCTLTFDQPGTYYVTASGTAADSVDSDWDGTPDTPVDCPIIAPVCVVTVQAPFLSGLELRPTAKTKANILPAFAADSRSYECTAEQSVSTFWLTAALSEDAPDGSAISVSYVKSDLTPASAALSSGTAKSLGLGSKLGNRSTRFTVTVGVEGNTQEYSIQVNPKKVGFLSDLTVASAEGGENLLQNFDSDDYSYSVAVAPGTDRLYFTAASHPVNAPAAAAAAGETELRQTGTNAMMNNAKVYKAVTPETIALTPDGSTVTCLTLSEPAATKAVFVTVTATNGSKTNSYVIRVNPAPAHAAAEEAFEGTGTAEDPFRIGTQAQLAELALMVNGGMNFAGKTVKLTADLTLPDDWTPMGCIRNCTMTVKEGLNAFSGTFDGDGHTVTVPKGGLPLFGYVENTTIKNLKIYGEEIAGFGLVNNFEGVSLTSVTVIENVTLLSGTKTLKSGLIGANITTNGWAGNSPGSTADIRNCTVEEGVVIGYDGTQSDIGSIAGRMQGTVTDCVSYAAVQGVNYVGGIIGTRDNSMGVNGDCGCTVSGCSFGGTVNGVNYVGGIAGGGYNAAADAPNGAKIALLGNTVTGTVTGTDCVGGITGGDPYVVQLWENVICAVKGNRFNGLVSGNTNVGAIVGHYNSLNCYDDISGNTYAAGRGAAAGIGSVSYIDTNASPIAAQFDPTAKNVTIGGVLYYSSETAKTGCPSGTTRLAHNRTDDPLGADAAALWAVSDALVPICLKLELKSGTPRTDYYVGDAIDLTGLTFTAKWNAGKEDTTVAAADLTVTGFDSSSRKNGTVILSYAGASYALNIRILEPAAPETKITVYFTLLGDTLHGEGGTVHTRRGGNLTAWLPKESYRLEPGSTVKDLLDAVEAEHDDVRFNGRNDPFGVYIESVTYDGLTLAELDNGPLTGWMYTVNGSHPDVGVDAKYLNAGDAVVFHYTDDYTVEEGSEDWSDAPAAKKETEKNNTLPFTDVAGHWAADAISYVYRSKLMTGVGDGRFDPDSTLNRAMLVTILYRLAGEPAVAAANPFSDVKSGRWYTNAIIWASENKLVSGYGDGRFGPSDTITREQMAQMIYAFARLMGYDTGKTNALNSFADAGEISPWALTALQWANAMGLVTGRSDTELAPGGTASRAEAAAILLRFIESAAK